MFICTTFQLLSIGKRFHDHSVKQIQGAFEDVKETITKLQSISFQKVVVLNQLRGLAPVNIRIPRLGEMLVHHRKPRMT